MKLKKALGMGKPCTAKSEEKFKELDIVPSLASKKVRTRATTVGK